MASAVSMVAAAQRLGADRRSLSRWVREGKIPPLACRRRPRLAVAPPAPDLGGAGLEPPKPQVPLTPEQWAQDIRRRYDLDVTEQQLVTLAAAALALALDPSTTPATALAAAGRYQQLVRQLNLEDAHHGETETARRVWNSRHPTLS
jgi:hypothetical protein